MKMKINRIFSMIMTTSILSLPTLVHAGNNDVTNIPGLESVQEAEVKGAGVIKVGCKVQHRKFGVGVVKNIQLGDNTTTVNVVFETYGSKWLIAEYANLKLVED